MGRPKLLLPWGERTVIETVLAAWQASQVERVLVVIHPADEALANICERAGVQVVIPATAPPDMRASLCEGLMVLQNEAHPIEADTFLVAPADLPELSSAVINLLISSHDPARPAILVPTHNGKHGHPALLPWTLAAAVHHLPASTGLKALFQQQGVREIACSAAGIPEDLDTPADYARLQQRKRDC